MSSSTGRFVWYDLMTTDTAAAQAFYTKVIGWGTRGMPGMEEEYTMWTAGEKPVGGLMTLAEEAKAMGAPPHWIAYVSVPDLQVAADRTSAMGGKVLVPPTEIPQDKGAFAILQDPQGAVFAAYSPKQASEDFTEPGALEFSWHELMTTDYEAATAFYAEVCGWVKSDAMDMGEGNIYQMYKVAGMELAMGGIFNKDPKMPMPPMWLYYVKVPDLDTALAAVTEHGGQVMNGPMEVPGGDRVAQCVDPQGAAFALHGK